jgi:hypothetical protein
VVAGSFTTGALCSALKTNSTTHDPLSAILSYGSFGLKEILEENFPSIKMRPYSGGRPSINKNEKGIGCGNN